MRCVIAGGGTGGHLFPGLAIAEAFVEREVQNEVLFVGTERGIEAKVLAGGKFPLKMIHARPFKGKSLPEKLRAIWSIPMAISEAFFILKNFQPRLVLGVGGYASGPTLLAASLLGMKRAIHEQNVVPGITNRLLKRFSQRVFVSFEETKRYFPAGKTILTGNPVRKEILNALPSLPPADHKAGKTRKDKEGKKPKGDRFTLLIFGGSAGAHRINESMMEALDLLCEMKPSLRFFHQTGNKDFDWISEGYQKRGFEALVKPFFDDMGTYYQLSDLVICRSGASTVAELSVCGKAAILIPYPYAAHNHQYLNAKRLVELGAARMIQDQELDGSLLAQTIHDLYQHPEERIKIGEAIQSFGRPDAAREIVNHCYALIQ